MPILTDFSCFLSFGSISIEKSAKKTYKYEDFYKTKPDFAHRIDLSDNDILSSDTKEPPKKALRKKQ